MRVHGYDHCVAADPDPTVAPEPFIDFNSGYVLRALDKFPTQGSKRPWRLHQNYALDIAGLRFAPLQDGVLQFRRSSEQRDRDADDHHRHRAPDDDRRDQPLLEPIRVADDQ
jgi:hypothetical protein